MENQLDKKMANNMETGANVCKVAPALGDYEAWYLDIMMKDICCAPRREYTSRRISCRDYKQYVRRFSACLGLSMVDLCFRNG